ncbi:MAG: AMP-binding protein [Burkholderiales bacterium]|nr:AMP-binding protein [Burkholderiales bacterium]
MTDPDLAVPSPEGWLNIADGIFHNARRRPRHPALIDGARTISYAELAVLVTRTARQFELSGVVPGDVLGLALADDADHVVALLATAWIGAVILPMDVRWTAEEKLRVASHFGARLVCVPAEGDALPGMRTLCFDRAWQQAVRDNDGRCTPVRQRAHPAVLSLSSGTTGTPKGPLVSHGHVLARLFIYSVSLTFNEADRFMTATPMYFGGGRYMTLAYLFMGATVVLYPPPYEPAQLVAAVAQQRINAIFLVPTLLRRLLELAGGAGPCLPGLRLLISSGSSLYPEERRRIMAGVSPHFFNFYSSTEGGGISVLRPEDPDAVATSVGRVVFSAEVQVVDADHGPLPAGATGHIRYRGGSVADGFHRDPEASAAAFRDGWYYPGDLGHFDADGYLHLTGRAKDMIIRGGVNIYPAEVEAVLAAHPAVAEAAVVAWPARDRGEEVAAFVVRRAEVGAPALIEFCRASLAAYKVPAAVFFVDALPRSGMGKVLKRELAATLPPHD